MKCRLCDREAVCLFCVDHRPLWMPPDLERPAAGPDEDTADLRPEDVAAAMSEDAQ